MIKRRRPTQSNHERWLVSYADFITLLFAFFVVLYASGQIDKKKVGMLSESIQYGFQDMGVFGAGPEIPARVDTKLSTPLDDSDSVELKRIQTELDQALRNEVEKGEIDVHTGREGLIVSLREIGFFDSGSAELRPKARDAFQTLVNVLKAKPRAIRIEGHTDDKPIHNRHFNSNWELSTARATEVVRVMVTDYGYPPEMLSASGYGQFHPSVDNTTESGRQANRRVDMVILSRPHASSAPVR